MHQHDLTTHRVYRSLVVISLIVLGGWTSNALTKFVLKAMVGISNFIQLMATFVGSYLVVFAAGVNGPVLYVFRFAFILNILVYTL